MKEIKYLSKNKKGFSIDNLTKKNFDYHTIYTYKSNEGIDWIRKITLLISIWDKYFYIDDESTIGKKKLWKTLLEARKNLKIYLLKTWFKKKKDAIIKDWINWDLNISEEDEIEIKMVKDEEKTHINKTIIEDEIDYEEEEKIKDNLRKEIIDEIESIIKKRETVFWKMSFWVFWKYNILELKKAIRYISTGRVDPLDLHIENFKKSNKVSEYLNEYKFPKRENVHMDPTPKWMNYVNKNLG